MEVNNNQNSLFEKAYNPVLQAGVVLIGIFGFMVFAKVIKSAGISDLENTFYWTIAASFMLFFALFNSIFSLSTNDISSYWTKSMLSFVGLAVASGALAYIFSSISINEAGAYKWIFIVFSFGYLVFLSIMGFMKRIVDFAQNEEWQKPKRRRRK